MVLVVVLAGSSLTGGSGGSNSLDDLYSVLVDEQMGQTSRPCREKSS